MSLEVCSIVHFETIYVIAVRAIIAQSKNLHMHVSSQFEQRKESESLIMSRIVSIDIFHQTTGEEIFNLEYPVGLIVDVVKVILDCRLTKQLNVIYTHTHTHTHTPTHTPTHSTHTPTHPHSHTHPTQHTHTHTHTHTTPSPHTNDIIFFNYYAYIWMNVFNWLNWCAFFHHKATYSTWCEVGDQPTMLILE